MTMLNKEGDFIKRKISGEKVEVEVLEHLDESGNSIYLERYERFLPPGEFDHGVYKHNCEACRSYGKNLACPPYSPIFSQYIGDAKTARVICLRIPLEYFDQIITEEKYRAGFRTVRRLLTDELLGYREKGYVIAGSGKCLACEQCSIETGDENCKYPERKVYSLESLGVNVIPLVKRSFNLDLEWSEDGRSASFVSSVGAVFYTD